MNFYECVVINLIKVKEDMTGWVMAEHGVPDSRWTVIKQIEDYITPSGRHYARWLCECSCEQHTQKGVVGTEVKSGRSKSCGCLRNELKKKYNTYDLSGEYGIGWTSNTNKEFYFDLDRFDDIKNICWCESVRHGLHCLLGRNIITGKLVSMHIYLGYKNYDHINRNELDNRSCNLRPCTQQENARNKSIRSDNTSGITGVDWSKNRQKWRVRIYNDQGKEILVGYFDNLDEAANARLEAEKRYYKEFSPNAGSKLTKTQSLGIKVTYEDELMKLLGD